MSEVYKLLIVVYISITVVRCNLSPCPEILIYFHHPMTNAFARIVIANPPKNFQRLTLKVSYQTREFFVDDYQGLINLRWPLNETLERIRRGEPLIYIVHFPKVKRVPDVVIISLDNTPICVNVAIDPLARIVELKHDLLPPPFDPASLPVNKITEVPPTSTTEVLNINHEVGKEDDSEKRPSFSKVKIDELSMGCGDINSKENFKFKDNVRLRPGQWPWLAAIYITNSTFEFHCSGTLISNRHILTAGHCTYYNDRKLTPNLLVVSLGRYRLDDWEEPLSDNYEVSSIDVHPDYNFGLTSEADLAILKLSKRVRFRPTVRHMCIQTNFGQRFGPVEERGYVAGWGDKTPASKEDREIVEESSVAKLHVPLIISPKKCAKKTRKLQEFITSKTFCSQSQNGVSGPCKGDSGTALALPVSKKFYLQGIVSIAAADKISIDCDHKDFVVYVDVYPYTYWILQKILEN
ncbi:GSCOCT00010655001.2-RA-CDS [Cotesia congregata]|uniref:Serine protease gastrulation defective-like n=1 Tax=Cotesia congregata TaxID=51543 RepID=A0A8J2EGM8_COTCN|nr:GSCOCT00010655001.2-RA-CDS [Cotesia congregata]CAG5075075.1 Serine protease gastrulation defective-like [Cotesia congregata]